MRLLPLFTLIAVAAATPFLKEEDITGDALSLSKRDCGTCYQHVNLCCDANECETVSC
ncbi:hypothetical protein CGRA01v4_01978 [Colletotrichum graminicola]|nr:hypothetical protein CGRA01v4_01978 [Colletotrichum graminicola]